jgi:hypothetical protein
MVFKIGGVYVTDRTPDLDGYLSYHDVRLAQHQKTGHSSSYPEYSPETCRQSVRYTSEHLATRHSLNSQSKLKVISKTEVMRSR